MRSGRIAQPHRGVLSVRPFEAAVSFLQGLHSNDLHPLLQTSPKTDGQDNDETVVHGAFLSSRGRVLCDAFVCRDSRGSRDAAIVDVPRVHQSRALDYLREMKLRRKIDVDPIDDFHVATAWNDENKDNTGGCVDPRAAVVGMDVRRIYETAPTSLNPEDVAAFAKRWAMVAAVCDDGEAAGWDVSLPHELNFDLFHSLCTTKGCYVGQEFVMRALSMVIRKRIVPWRAPSPASLPEPSEMCGKDVVVGEKRVGKVRWCCGDVGLATMRLGALSRKVTKAHVGDIAVELEVPTWWPESVMEGLDES